MKRPLAGILVLFLTLNGLLLLQPAWWERLGADRDVLLAGNLFLCAVTLLSYFMARRGLSNPNPHAFVRSVYGSILLKLFLCLLAALSYIALQGKALNKPAFFGLMGLYLLYTFIEVRTLLAALRKPKG